MISYKPLLKTLIDKEISKEEFRKRVGISSKTLAKMNPKNGRAEYVALSVIDRICNELNVPIDQVIEHVPEE